MAQDITQTLGFDVAKALDALQSLDKHLAKFDERLTKLATTIEFFNKKAGAQVAAMERMQEGVKGISTTATRAEKQITKSNDRIGQSFSDMGKIGSFNVSLIDKSITTLVRRVLVTQVVVAQIQRVRREFEEAFDSAIAFEKQIGQIRTISAEKNFETLAKTVRNLSDEFNQPLDDVGAGFLEVISQQVQGFENQIKVAEAVTKFSKVSSSTTADSINLITGTINAFNRDALEAESIAAKFFKTIDLGNTVASELATSFGRVAPIAHAAGISMEEVQAAFAAITIGGVKTNEAATQIRAAISALLKPSEAAKAALRELGFESGDQAVRALGLVGALKALIETTDGSTTAQAALFQNVRALNGVLRLTGSGAEAYAKSLEEIRNTDLTDLQNQFKSLSEIDAEKVTRAFNKLENFFTVDIGRGLVASTDNLLELIGGIEFLIELSKNLTVPILGGAAAFGIFKLSAFNAGKEAVLLAQREQLIAEGATAAAAQAEKAAGSFGRMSRVLAGIGQITIGVSLAVSLGEAIGDVISERLAAADKVQAELDRIELKQTRERNRKILADIEERNREILADEEKKIAELRKLHFKNVDNQRIANEQLVDDVKDTVGQIVDLQEQRVRDLERAETRFRDSVDSSQRRAIELEDRLSDEKFNRKIVELEEEKKINDQFLKLRQRAAQINARAEMELLAAKSTEDESAAVAQFERALRFAEQAEALAQESGNKEAVKTAQREVDAILKSQLATEKQLQRLQQQRAEEAELLTKAERDRLERLKKLAVEITDNSSLFDSDGNELPIEERSKRVKQFQKSFAQFRSLALESGASLQDVLGVASLGQRITEQLASAQITQLKLAPGTLEKLNAEIFRTAAPVELRANVKLELDEEFLAEQIRFIEAETNRVAEQIQQRIAANAAAGRGITQSRSARIAGVLEGMVGQATGGLAGRTGTLAEADHCQ